MSYFSISSEDLEKKYNFFIEEISNITNSNISHFLFGIELEFYVNLTGNKEFNISDDVKKFELLKNEINNFAINNKIEILNISEETGFNQFEINFKPYKSIIKLANDIELLKSIKSNNFEFIFETKPYKEKPSSTMHINISAYNAKFQNIFYLNEKYMNLCIYGILINAIKMSHMYIKDPEDYIRFLKKRNDFTVFEPYNISYGIDNRTCLIRYPKSSIKDLINDKRFEFRMCSVTSNFKNAIYAIISSIYYIFKNKILENLEEFKIYGNASDVHYSHLSILPRNAKIAEESFDKNILI